MNQNNKLYIVILAIAMVLAFFLGRQSKKCESIKDVIIEKVVTDTVYRDAPIEPKTIHSVPKNVNKNTNYNSDKNIKGIDFSLNIQKKAADTNYNSDLHYDFEQLDTLDYKGLKIAVKDKGNCFGVYDRNTTFFGSLPERIITNTNYVTLPHIEPLFSIHAGASASFSNRWKVFDVGPNLMISLSNKHNASISYMMNTSTINLNLSTRIK